ncbi:TonB-dependent receptor [Sandaracinobacteroides saxicola]|uniref:TonB-dependent receptor n=1 Tax=Sandaracinobacteroides saxicola TaxID=2759707 RepID=A0A7G5IHN6_9SPHN|nr:TonB-dependent receptor [Sandaracinobacteroides saxicola]QMW22878.1 TonB-dependent receptor [Sandaracinobacteroides saxicola]
MMRTGARGMRVAGCSLLAMIMAGSAGAQNQAAGADGGDIGDIIVTARKRSENLQDVPLAIRAITADTIEREGVVRIDDIARRTAGLTFDIGGFPNDTRPALRGMQAERGRPSVAVLIDGQDLSGENLSIAGGSASLNAALFDLERIEVVKGPQSTLYGRSAFAGAINYITAPPSFTLGAKINGEVAEYGTRAVSASVTGPLIPELLAIRVNGAYRENNGFYRHPVNGSRLDAAESQGAAVSLLLTPAPDVRISARYQYSLDKMSDMATAFIGANTRLVAPGALYSPFPGPPATIPCPSVVSGLTPAQQTQCTRGTLVGPIGAGVSNVQMSLNPLTGQAPYGMRLKQHIGDVKIGWDFGDGSLDYRFGYLKNRSDIETDGDFSDFPAAPGPVLALQVLQQLRYDNRHIDNELRYSQKLGRIDLVVGAQYFVEDSSLSNGSQFWLRNPASPLAGPPFNLATAPNNLGLFPVVNSRETKYLGLFGSLAWQISDQLKLSLEGRFGRDKITYLASGWRRQDTSLSRLRPLCLPQFANGATFSPTNPAGTPPPGVVAACPINNQLISEKFTPRVTLEYKATPDALLYASFAQGSKPGGFNTNEIVSFTGQGYRPERVNAWEAGAKTQWLDRRLTLNADVYYNDYKDQQIGVQNTNITPSGQVVTTAGIVNAGRVRVYGFELDADLRATEQLSLFASYAYTDSKFKSYVQGPPPGSNAAAFAACGVPAGQTSSDQNRAEAGNICADFSGNVVGKSPKHSLNLGATWRQGFGSGRDNWFLQADASHRSKRFTDESNLAFLPGYWRMNLRAGIEVAGFSVTAYLDNVFDDRRIESAQRNVDFGRPEGFAPGRAFIAYLPRPRTFGVRAGFKF